MCRGTSMRQNASCPKKEKVDTRDKTRETTRDCRGESSAPVWRIHQQRRSPGETSVREPTAV